MRIAGCDYSTRTLDLVTITLEGPPQPVWTCVPLTRGGFDPARHMRHSLNAAGITDSWFDDVAAVYMEDAMSMSKGVAKALALVAGALMSSIPERVLVERLKPAVWKQTIGLPGNASKQQVAAWTVELHPETAAWSQDGLDALAIALAGRRLCEIGAAA